MTKGEMINGLCYIKNWKCNGDAKMHEAVFKAIEEKTLKITLVGCGLEQTGGTGMTTVKCGLDKCIHNNDGTCTSEEIYLDEEHYCIGGCDDGWDLEDEWEEDE